jgi:hypothetical protein
MEKYGYIAMYRGKKLELYAETKLKAQEEAAKRFKARKAYEVDVYLCEKPDGSTVLQSTCI